MRRTNVSLKRKIAVLLVLLVLAITGVAQTGGRHGYVSAINKAPSTEVRTMIDYIRKAEKGGLDVQLYLSELADQMAYLALGDQISAEIMQQGEAAARLYAHPLVLNNFASLLVKIGQVGQAISYLKVAYGQDPENPMLAQNLARCYFSQGKFDLAETYCREALRLDGDYGLALQLRAMLYLRNEKDQVKAIEPMLKSALTVWNDISISQFSSLRNVLDELVAKDATKSPLDKYVNLLLDVCKVDRIESPSISGGSFVFCRKNDDPEALLESFKQEVGDMTVDINATLARGLAQIADTLRKTLSSKEPELLYDDEGNPKTEEMLLDDSRQICAALLLMCHYKIKEAEMIHNEIEYGKSLTSGLRLDDLVEKRNWIRDEYNRKVKEMTGDLKKEIGSKLMSLLQGYMPGNINVDPKALERITAWKLGEDKRLYNENVNFGSRFLKAERAVYERYRRPFLREYDRNMRKALFYIKDDRERKSLGKAIDERIEALYIEEYTSIQKKYHGWVDELLLNEIELVGSQMAVNAGKPVVTEEQRRKRQMEWEEKQVSDLATSRGAPKTAGMLQIKVAFGGLSAHFGADGYGRIHYGYETDGSVYRVARNLSSGVRTTTTIDKVVSSYLSVAGAYGYEAVSVAAEFVGKPYGNSTTKLGGFLPATSSSGGMGMQITRDRYGNILNQAKVSYSSSSAGMQGLSYSSQSVTRQRGNMASSVSQTSGQAMVGYSVSSFGASAGISFGGIER